MSIKVWRRLGALGLAAVLAAGAAGLAGAAQRLDGQIVVKSNGTIYLIQNGMRYLVQPVPMGDGEIDSIPDGGSILSLTGVAAGAAVLDPAAGQPDTAADLLFSQYWTYGQWDRAYALLHPDIQALVPRNMFMDTMRAYATTFTITGSRVGRVDMLPSWTEPLTSKSYSDVAYVPVTLTIQRGGQTSNTRYDLYLAKVGDYWRWFWSPPGG